MIMYYNFRWANPAACILALHHQTKKPTKWHRKAVMFIMYVYAPTIFAISRDPHICSGSKHLFNMFKWARDLLDKDDDFDMISSEDEDEEDEDEDKDENIKLLKDLKVPELKNSLKIRSLVTSGLKSVLADRLKDYLEENGLDPETYDFNEENPNEEDEEESENENSKNKDWNQFLKSFFNNNWFCHIGKKQRISHFPIRL